MAVAGLGIDIGRMYLIKNELQAFADSAALTVATSFAKGETAPDPNTWQAEPSAAGDFHFVRVVVSAPAPLIFLRAFQPLKTDASLVAAASVAVKTPQAARLVQ